VTTGALLLIQRLSGGDRRGAGRHRVLQPGRLRMMMHSAFRRMLMGLRRTSAERDRTKRREREKKYCVAY